MKTGNNLYCAASFTVITSRGLLTAILRLVDVVPASHPIVPRVVFGPSPKASHHIQRIVVRGSPVGCLNRGLPDHCSSFEYTRAGEIG